MDANRLKDRKRFAGYAKTARVEDKSDIALVTHAPEVLYELREARAMLSIVGFSEPDPDYERSWRRALKRIDSAIRKAEGR